MGLMKKLTSAVVASSLVLGLVGTAAAAPSSAQLNEAYARLSAYSVVQGKTQADGTVSPALGDSLTRAELVTILARGFGQEETAKLLKGATSFKDVPAAEWYSGYVALVKNIAEQKGTTIGYEDGTFKPSQNVKAVEALAFIMKLLGVKPATGANWVADTVKAAQAAGVITAADVAAYLDAPEAAATRGLAFALADAIFRTYQVTPGKTVYTTYVDTTAPVLTVKAPAAPTTTAAKATITGSVTGATALFLGSEKITVNTDGTFSVAVDLKVGDAKANTFTFSAVDLAGNVSTATYAVARTPGVAKSVTAALDATTLAVDGTAKLAVKVLDENNVEITPDTALLKVTVAGGIGAVADGVFTAGTKAATGTITVTYGELSAAAINVTVNAGEIAKIAVSKTSVAKGEKVTLTAQDKYDNAITGATYTVSSADAFLNGNVFTALESGTYTVTATAGGKTATVNVGIWDAATKLVVETVKEAVANNGTWYSVTVRAADKNNNHVALADNAQNVKLTVPGGTVADKDKANGTSDNMTKALVNGAYTFQVKVGAATAGQTLTFTAEDTAATGALTKGTASVTSVAQVATKVTLTPAADYVIVNDSGKTVKVTAAVVDQANVAMVNGAYEVKVTVSGPATIDSENGLYTTAGGKKDITVTSQKSVTGTITLTAAVDGFATVSKSVSAVLAGDAKKADMKLSLASDTNNAAVTSVKATDVVKVTGQITDANGIKVDNTSELTIALTKDVKAAAYTALADVGDATKVKTKVIPNADGSYEFYVATTAAFTGNVEVKVSNSTIGSVAKTVAFTAGDFTHVALTRDGEVTIPVANAAASVTAQLFDAKGNKVAVAGKDLTFTANVDGVTIEGTAKTKTVKTDATGAATVNMTMMPFSNSQPAEYTIKVTGKNFEAGNLLATDTGTDDVKLVLAYSVAKDITLSVLDSTNKQSLSTLFLANGTTEVIVRAVVKDNYGNALTGQASYLTLTGGTIFWDAVAEKLVDASKAGVTFAPVANTPGTYEATVKVAKAGFNTFGVKIATGTADVTASANLVVNAAAASKAIVKEATSTGITVKGGTVAGPFTVQLADAYGNAVSSNTKVTLKLSGDASVRKAAGDVTATTLDIYSTATIYVTTPATGNYEIVFTVGNTTGDFGTVKVVAE